MFRDTLPNVNAGACEKAAGFVYPYSRSVTLPDTDGLMGVAFGRCSPVPMFDLRFCW